MLRVWGGFRLVVGITIGIGIHMYVFIYINMYMHIYLDGGVGLQTVCEAACRVFSFWSSLIRQLR